jgi:sporulation protein YlmC with PRC-barrel domain
LGTGDVRFKTREEKVIIAYGKIVCVIVNPIHRQLSHVVVKEKGFVGLERLVPMAWVSESTPEEIHLGCTHRELANAEEFIDVQYMEGINPFEDFEPEEYRMWPYVIPEEEWQPLDIERIPPGELGFHRGARVEASDGPIGKIDEFLVNPDDLHISHLILREGHLWHPKRVSIPISAIQRFQDDVVTLNLSREEVEKLPEISVQGPLT